MLIVPIISSPFYEFFSKSHYLLGLFLVYAIWRHLPVKNDISRYYLIIALATLTLTTILRYSRIIFRSIRWSKPNATTTLRQIDNAIVAQIHIPRPWKIRAGQFIYIWMPGVSPFSFFQSHPFMISWWDQDSSGRGETIYLLLKPRSGFTQRLLRHLDSPGLSTSVDGPYGERIKTKDFGQIIMFASGIGIAAQIPYIKELLEGAENRSVCTRRILLIWQLDKESKHHTFRSHLYSRLISKASKIGSQSGWPNFSQRIKKRM